MTLASAVETVGSINCVMSCLLARSLEMSSKARPGKGVEGIFMGRPVEDQFETFG
jgi:hypothetical protein